MEIKQENSTVTVSMTAEVAPVEDLLFVALLGMMPVLQMPVLQD